MRDTVADRVFLGLIYLLMIAVIVVMLYPFWGQLVLSLSTREAALRGGIGLIPWPIKLDAYERILGSREVARSALNTLYRVAMGTVWTVFITALTAYPLARRDFPLNGLFTGLILFTMLFGGGLIPGYLLRKDLHLIDKRLVLILPGIGAYNLIIVRNFFRSLPRELEEAAQLDGASDFGIWSRVVIPLSKPVLATIALWTAVAHWNAYFDALIYITDRSKYVLQVVLRRILLEGQIEFYLAAGMNVGSDPTASMQQPTEETVKAALIMVTTVPILLVYPFLQRYFIKGVMLGSLKG